MHNACKTGAMLRKFTFRANKPTCLPTVGGGGGSSKHDLGIFNVEKF
jgi:hypothetical protein